MDRKNILMITVFLIITLLFIPKIVHSNYPEVIVYYRSFVEFDNFIVKDFGTSFVLNGYINGILHAKYIYRENGVVVSLKYLEYNLSGFEDYLSRQYIVSKLNEESKYFFGKNEYPYEINKPFILEGSIKYYVSPSNLDLSGIVEQRVSFVLDNYTVLFETRFFKYDLATGILIELRVNSRLYINETLLSNYTIWFKQIHSDNYRLSINQLNSQTLLSISIITLIVFIKSMYLGSKIFVKKKSDSKKYF
uniref:Uncharacterized protein n=1 Tax=Staphylothermus marinus TaxID=2280 RepID=A0A7C4HE15_STAMA